MSAEPVWWEIILDNVAELYLEHKEETLTFSHKSVIVIYHADAVLSI